MLVNNALGRTLVPLQDDNYWILLSVVLVEFNLNIINYQYTCFFILHLYPYIFLR